ncbi:unnamed protein product [Ilex paraguariensis]|uniref:Uncharacterized protein n=1 Tax=Ilex paraguariensis TaxID=185542 RepID=A0ABC8RWU7_9AQUA
MKGAYKNLLDAFLKVLQEGGPAELYRGLTPSIIGVIPYAATNYFAYNSLRKAYKKVFNREEIGNTATLFIGSAAGAISSSATFPLEVARKHMQVDALNGRHYKNLLHAVSSILEKEGVPGLYSGLGPNCIKLVPAAGISFMCYEACKNILAKEEDDP